MGPLPEFGELTSAAIEDFSFTQKATGMREIAIIALTAAAHLTALLALQLIFSLPFSFAEASSGLSRVTASAVPVDIKPRISDLVCSLSLFFSIMPEDRIERPAVTNAALDGRGILSCKNDQGFSSEVPVLASLQADLPTPKKPVVAVPARGPASTSATIIDENTEISFSGNADEFVIPREINQIYDVYTVRNFSWENPSSLEPSVLFRGGRNDLVMDMKLTSRTANVAGLKVRSLKLSFDDQAPDLEREP